MIDSFHVKKPIYPIFTITSAVLIFVGALLFARCISGVIFLAAVFLLLICFGYGKTCLKMIPFLVIYLAVFSAIFYFASHRNLTFALQMAVRLAGVVIAFIPGISLPPVNLVRNLNQLKCPKLLSLGMLITLTFIPVLSGEIKQIRNAMKTRVAVNVFKPQVIYRSFLIPLIVRIVNISDTLSFSVETRGFMADDVKPSVYKTVSITVRDIVFAVLFMMIFIFCLVFTLVVKK